MNNPVLYVNGCSFSMDPHLKFDLGRPLWADLVAQHLDMPVINHAWPGSCNRRIIRTTARRCLELVPGSRVILQLTMLARTEKPYQANDYNAWKMRPDCNQGEYHESIKDPDSSDPDEAAYMRWYLRHWEATAALHDLAADLVMLSALMRGRQISYQIFAYNEISYGVDPALATSDLIRELDRDANIMDIMGTGLTGALPQDPELYHDGLHNHFSEKGHACAAQWLINRLCAPVL